jgi:hypothetical protein
MNRSCRRLTLTLGALVAAVALAPGVAFAAVDDVVAADAYPPRPPTQPPTPPVTPPVTPPQPGPVDVLPEVEEPPTDDDGAVLPEREEPAVEGEVRDRPAERGEVVSPVEAVRIADTRGERLAVTGGDLLGIAAAGAVLVTLGVLALGGSRGRGHRAAGRGGSRGR